MIVNNRTYKQKNSDFHLVRCVYCGGCLCVNSRISDYCILSCKNNHKFPVVAGVLYLGNKTIINKTNKLIKKGKNLDALLLLLDLRKTIYIPLLILLRTNIKFEKFIKILKLFGLNKDWTSYLKNRNKNISFISAKKILNLHNKNEKFLDLGCGIGQLLPLVYKKTLPENVFGIDISFLNLLIARKYFSDKKTTLLCMDLENKLPFNEGVFDSVIIMDTFHYITAKNRLLGDCYRTTKSGGKIDIIQTINSRSVAFGNIKGLRPDNMKYILNNNNYKRIQLQTMSGEVVYNANAIKNNEAYNVLAQK